MPFVLALAAGLGLPTLVGRRLRTCAARLEETRCEWEERERLAAIFWTTHRLRAQGLTGDDLQEAVCRVSGCTPPDADVAIGLVIDVTDHADADPTVPRCESDRSR